MLDLSGTSFAVDVLSARIDYAYSTRLLGGAWIQYNDTTGELVTNVRVNLVHAPLSDLFVVLTERRDTDPGPGLGDVVLDRRLTVKVTKLFAF